MFYVRQSHLIQLRTLISDHHVCVLALLHTYVLPCSITDPSVTDLNTRSFTCYGVRVSTFLAQLKVLIIFIDELNDCCSGTSEAYFSFGSDCIVCKWLFVHVLIN